MEFLKSIKIKPLDIVIILLLFISSFSTLLIFRSHTAGALADVKVKGQVVKELDLSQNQTWTFNSNGEINVIEVKNGAVRVTEANCPDKLDVKQGWISKVGQTIVCLPHNLVIQVISGQQEQGVDYVG